MVGEYDMPDVLFQHVPPDAKDFISKLLVIDPNERMSAEQALAHPWLRRSTRYVSAYILYYVFATTAVSLEPLPTQLAVGDQSVKPRRQSSRLSNFPRVLIEPTFVSGFKSDEHLGVSDPCEAELRNLISTADARIPPPPPPHQCAAGNLWHDAARCYGLDECTANSVV